MRVDFYCSANPIIHEIHFCQDPYCRIPIKLAHSLSIRGGTEGLANANNPDSRTLKKRRAPTLLNHFTSNVIDFVGLDARAR